MGLMQELESSTCLTTTRGVSSHLLHIVELGKQNGDPPLPLLGYVDPECRPGSLVPILA